MFKYAYLTLGFDIVNPKVTLVVEFIALWAALVGLFYLACKWMEFKPPSFATVAGMTAANLVCASIVTLLAVFLFDKYLMPFGWHFGLAMQHMPYVYSVIVGIWVALLGFFMFFGAKLYPRFIDTEQGGSLAAVQMGGPVACVVLIVLAMATGIWDRRASELFAAESRYFSQQIHGLTNADDSDLNVEFRPRSPSRSRPSPSLEPTPSFRPVRPPSTTSRPPSTSRPSVSNLPVTGRTEDEPSLPAANPTPLPVRPALPSGNPTLDPTENRLPVVMGPQIPGIDPRDPYATAASTVPRAFGSSAMNSVPSSSNLPSIPSQRPPTDRPGVGGSVPIPDPASLPSVNPATPTTERPQPTEVAMGTPAFTPETAAGPLPDSLMGKADWALEHQQLAAAFQYLYAAAVIENDPAVWDRVSWNETLERPEIAISWGLGVECDAPHDDSLEEATSGVLAALRSQLEKVTGAGSLGKHAANLVKSLEPGRKREDLLASARLAGVDVLAILDMEVRFTPTTRRQELLISFDFFDVASGKALWRSEPLSRTKFLLGQQQGKDLGLEMAAEAGSQAQKIGRTTKTCAIDPSAARTRCRELVDARPAQPLSALFQIRYLQRQQKLTEREASLFVANLVGGEASQMLSSNHLADKQALVERWTPKLQGAPPAANSASPADGTSIIPGTDSPGVPSALVPVP